MSKGALILRADFIDDNYDGSTSATALATLTNSWALLVNPFNPLVVRRLD